MICSLCNSITTYIDPNGKVRWFKLNGTIVCKKCHQKDYRYKNYNIIREKQIQNREKDRERVKKYYRENPEIHLKAIKKQLNNMAKIFDMKSYQYKYANMNWAKSIRKRDDNTCKQCENKANISHHIFYKSKYPQLSLNLNNGISLCKDCHYELHNLNGWILQ